MKILLLILFSLHLVLLPAQNLDDKKQELEKLKAEIILQEKHIKELENARKKAEQELSSQKKKKTETENKIKNLQQSESDAKAQLSATKKELFSTENKLQFLENLRHDEINRLCYAHYEKLLFPKKEIDSQLLANLIRFTTFEIQTFFDKKRNLETKQSKETKQFETFQWSRIQSQKQDKQITSSISKISGTIQKTSAEQLEAKKRKEQLEKEEQALNDLIARLQISLIDRELSFKFSTPRLMWPLKGKILRPFGEQKSDVYNVSILNNGIDIEADVGSEVKAVDNGIVAFAEWYQGAGRLVIIDHQNGYFSLYSHNSSLLVSKGDTIKRGQKIALSGQSGSTDEPCLHFEIRRRGNPVNPLDYLE
jgi:septal ring factor EnvC (AmiA/AmiB activator)